MYTHVDYIAALVSTIHGSNGQNCQITEEDCKFTRKTGKT